MQINICKKLYSDFEKLVEYWDEKKALNHEFFDKVKNHIDVNFGRYESDPSDITIIFSAKTKLGQYVLEEHQKVSA